MGDHVAKSALLVIDMQKYFLQGGDDGDTRQLIDSCREAISVARAAAMPIVHILTEYRADQKDWPEAWRGRQGAWCANLVAGHELAELIDGIDIHPQDLQIEKRRFSGFYDTELDDILRCLGCDLVYAIGYSAEVSVLMTLNDAYNRGYWTGIIEEGVATGREFGKGFFGYLEHFIGTRRLTLEQFRQQLAM